MLLTFIGPWNEFLWPFLITKQADLQPLAVSLANYITNVAGRAANPYGAILAGAVVLAAPAVVLFVVFQKHFTASEHRLRGQGMTQAPTVVGTEVPYRLTRLGVLMSPDPDDPLEAEGVLNPASGRDPDGRLYAAAPDRRRRQRLPGRPGRGRAARRRPGRGATRRGVVLAPDAGWERGAGTPASRTPG